MKGVLTKFQRILSEVGLFVVSKHKQADLVGRAVNSIKEYYSMLSLEFCSKTEALKLIEEKVGFKKPSVKYLHWYFKCNQDGLYYPLVDFKSLRAELEKEDLITKMANVAHLAENNFSRQAVVAEIREVVFNNRRKNSAY